MVLTTLTTPRGFFSRSCPPSDMSNLLNKTCLQARSNRHTHTHTMLCCVYIYIYNNGTNKQLSDANINTNQRTTNTRVHLPYNKYARPQKFALSTLEPRNPQVKHLHRELSVTPRSASSPPNGKRHPIFLAKGSMNFCMTWFPWGLSMSSRTWPFSCLARSCRLHGGKSPL